MSALIAKVDRIRYYGTGTQKAYDELARNLSPRLVYLRMDVDTTRKKGSHEALVGPVWSRDKRIFLLGNPDDCKGLGFSPM